MKQQRLITIGVLGALAVILGALGAHALREQEKTGLMDAVKLNGFETAVRYHMYHTFGMLLVMLLQPSFPGKAMDWAYRFFFIGILLFSGSLYFLTTRSLVHMEGLTVLGPVTPVGGLFFVAGWISIIFAGIKKS